MGNLGRRIGLFGGAFDPFHNGHLSVIESVMASGIVDECWVIPTFSPPHRAQAFYPYRHRKLMAELAVENIPGVLVSNVEAHLSKPSYTWKTLEHFKSGEPDARFFLCLGEDSLSSFHTWMNADFILEMCTLLVAERPGYHPAQISKNILDKTIFLDHSPVNLSSSEIKKRAQNSIPDPTVLPHAVYTYLISSL